MTAPTRSHPVGISSPPRASAATSRVASALPQPTRAHGDERKSDSGAMPAHVGHKIDTIAELFAKAERRVGRHQLAIERITDILGRPSTLYLLATSIVVWMVGNGLAPRFGVRPIDPAPFLYLQVTTCIAAVLMGVTILTTQNRVAKLAMQRAHLDLQVNLIAEEKIAKLIALVEELRRDLPSVKNRRDSLADAMTEAVDLAAVAGKLETIQDEGTPLVPLGKP